MARKIERANELIKRVLGRIILEKFEGPEGCLVTVAETSINKNFDEVKVYLNIFPTEKIEKIFNLLERDKKFLQKELAQKISFYSLLRIKFIPKLDLE